MYELISYFIIYFDHCLSLFVCVQWSEKPAWLTCELSPDLMECLLSPTVRH